MPPLAQPRLIGHIAELWRYPVKSMGGERCATLHLTPTGILGDRLFAFRSADAPTGKPLLRAAQRAAMLRAHATLSADGEPLIHLPHMPPLLATAPDTPARLTGVLGLPPGTALSLIQSPRPLSDVRPVAIHSTTLIHTLAHELDTARLPGTEIGFDHRRLRSNLLLRLDPVALAEALHLAPTQLPPFPEDLLAGRTLLLGDQARLHILERIPRCRIVSLAPATATHDPHLLKHLARTHNGRAGIYARPLTPGPLHENDSVQLL